ncbi:universal stress protein [Scrofimicrobium sp. R131]|uniref:Universal stress protein n=1 Tax=Scrofimicrobium appendicitidis TaxID=3079930 RepID=A0AAU7V840_9ACTO
MRVLAAFSYSLGGRDAFALGYSLAKALNCPLDLVTIVRGGEESVALTTTKTAFDREVAAQIDRWMDEVIGETDGSVVPTKNLRYAMSYPEGLLAAVEEFGSTLLVIGGGRHGAFGQVSLGAVGNTMLHSSPVPVALAPRGFRNHPYTKLGRVSAIVGDTGERGQVVLKAAAEYANASSAGLRLVSISTASRVRRTGEEAEQRGERIAEAAKSVSLNSGAIPLSEVAQGDNIEEAVATIKWKKQEIALMGSGRLAQKGRLFLGSTANRILRVLPVPLVVVPAGWEGEAS